MDIKGQIIEIIAKQLEMDPQQITPEADFANDLGVDSLDGVELVMAVEEEFGIEIPDEDAERMKKVKDIISYLEKKLDT